MLAKKKTRQYLHMSLNDSLLISWRQINDNLYHTSSHLQYQFKVWGEFSCFIHEANLLRSLSTSKKLRNDITLLKSFLCSYQRLKYRKTLRIQNAGMLSTGNPSGERTEGAKNWFIEKIKDSCFFAFCNRDIMGSYIFNSN